MQYLRTYQLRRLADTHPNPWTITTDQLAAWLASHHWSPSTIRSWRSMLGSFYRWAVTTGRTTTSPAAALPRPPRIQLRARPAPPDVVEEALATSDQRLALMVRLARHGGLRRGEIAAVHTDDLLGEPDGWWLIVHGKGSKSVGSRVNADKILYVSLAVSPRSASLEVSLQEHATVPSTVRIGGRVLRLTPVFETYWRFAAERQATYLRKQYGLPSPWTKDPVIAAHRFTNCYRATDRVSQFLINHVIYEGVQKPEEVVFRTLLFKFFNKIPTWQWLQRRLGELTWRDFDADQYGHVLGELAAAGEALYSAAYVMPSPRFGHSRKFRNHLALLEHMMRSGVTRRLQDATSMAQAFEVLRGYRGLGDFLAFQYLIDINYSEVLGFDEMEYVVAGPGARSGIRKAFGPASMGLEREIIAFMADQQENFFSALGLSFGWLKGRPLQLIDCQNLFCEVDKYARVAHPEVSGGTGRHRIKQRYAADSAPMEAAALPPKWHTEVPKLDIIV